MKTYDIIWPGTPRAVTEAQVLGWYRDAVAEGKLEPGLSVEDAVKGLEDIGQVTFKRLIEDHYGQGRFHAQIGKTPVRGMPDTYYHGYSDGVDATTQPS